MVDVIVVKANRKASHCVKYFKCKIKVKLTIILLSPLENFNSFTCFYSLKAFKSVYKKVAARVCQTYSQKKKLLEFALRKISSSRPVLLSQPIPGGKLNNSDVNLFHYKVKRILSFSE